MLLRRRTSIGMIGSGFATALLPAVGRAQPAKKTRIAFANYDEEASFGTLVQNGIRKAAAAHPDYDVTYYDNKHDGPAAVENARTVSIVHPDVFIEYNSIVPQANTQVARLMKQAAIPILSVQVRVPDTPLFAVDNPMSGYEAGKAVAMAAKQRWGGETPVVLLLTLPEGGPLFLERTAGARKGIQEVFPDSAAAEFSTKNDVGTARQVTSDFLTKNPGKKIAIWAHVDAMGIAALTAARNAGREGDVLLSSTGGEASVFPEIRKPNSVYIGTFSFFPEYWGEDLLPLAARLARGDSIPDTSKPSKELFLTTANLDQYYPRG